MDIGVSKAVQKTWTQGDYILVGRQKIKHINKYTKMIIGDTEKYYIKDKVIGRNGL